MNIYANSVVTLSFRLLSSEGVLIEESSAPVAYLHGGYSGIFPKIEEALNGKKIGERVQVSLDPTEAFGEFNPELIRVVPASDLPPDITVGGFLSSDQSDTLWRVTDISDDKVVLDGNHELAGQRLLFDCVVEGVREATLDEMEHGHAHHDGEDHACDGGAAHESEAGSCGCGCDCGGEADEDDEARDPTPLPHQKH